MRQNDLEKISFVGGLVGVSVFILYLDLLRLNIVLPFEVLVSGIILFSLALTIFYVKTTKERIPTYAFATLYLVSFAMLTLYSFRYDLFGGPDTIGEYVIATKTFDLSRWPVESLMVGWGDRAGRYASCLSVTVFPAMLSKVSGISILDLFKFVLPAIGAFVPIVSYLVVSEMVEDKRIAFLSAALVGTAHLQIFLISYLFREQIAILFLLLSVYLLLRFQKKYLPVYIMLLGVLFSNAGHATADFSILLIAGFLLVALFFFAKRKGRSLSWWPLIFYPFATFLYLYFFAQPLLIQQFAVLTEVVSDFIRYFPHYLNRLISSGTIFPSQSLIGVGLPVSVLLKYWYYLTVVLALFGLFSAFLMFRRNERKLPVVAYYFLMSSVFVFTTLAPGFLPELDAPRIFADPIFPMFTGIALSVPYLLYTRKNIRVFKYISLLIVVFLFLTPLMNLNLIDYQRILHYNSEDVLPSATRAVYFDVSFSDKVVADFVGSYIPNQLWISVDQRGFDIAYLADHVNKTYSTYPTYSTQSVFLILHIYYVKDDIWITPYQSTAYPSKNVTWHDLTMENSIVVSNGKMFMAMNASKSVQ